MLEELSLLEARVYLLFPVTHRQPHNCSGPCWYLLISKRSSGKGFWHKNMGTSCSSDMQACCIWYYRRINIACVSGLSLALFEGSPEWESNTLYFDSKDIQQTPFKVQPEHAISWCLPHSRTHTPDISKLWKLDRLLCIRCHPRSSLSPSSAASLFYICLVFLFDCRSGMWINENDFAAKTLPELCFNTTNSKPL